MMTAMKGGRVLLVIVLVLTDSLVYSQLSYDQLDSEVGPVVYTNILYRHGDRTPLEFFPTDPNKDPALWPQGMGQLTKRGMAQHYELGGWLRRSYSALLSSDYRGSEVYVSSTDIDRTLMSAMANLAGLFPPPDNGRWNPSLSWQPIPVHTVPQTLDKVLWMGASCPRYAQLYQSVVNSAKAKRITRKYQKLLNYVSKHAGVTYDDILLLTYVYSNLYIEEQNNLTQAEWARKVYPEPLRTASAVGFSMQTFDRDLQRLKAGPLLKEMLEGFVNKTQGRLERKMRIYSAHDITLVHVLNTLGVYNYLNPPYASALLLDLRYGRDGKYYVTLGYRNETGVPPYLLSVKGCCREVCPLGKLVRLLNDVIPLDWDRECSMSMFPALHTQLPEDGDDAPSLESDFEMGEVNGGGGGQGSAVSAQQLLRDNYNLP